MAIRIFSLDFDGCLSNVACNKDPNRDFIQANQAFFDYASSAIKSDELVYLMVGSNRQSYRDDAKNSSNRASGSCFPVLKKIAKELSKSFRRRVHVIPNLMADIYGDLPSGKSFAKGIRSCVAHDEAIMKHLKKIKITDDEKTQVTQSLSSEGHAEWVGDRSKLSVLCAQMQQIANDFPNEKITYEFFDDKEDILKPLADFLGNPQNAHWIPKNVQLVLNHYDGKEVKKLCEPIQGTGEIDPNYRETIIKMAEIVSGKTRDQFFEKNSVVKFGIPNYHFIDEFNKSPAKCQEFSNYLSKNKPTQNNLPVSTDTLPQPVALLDVDDTLVTGSQKQNIVLRQQLKAAGVTQVWFYTDMSPRDIQRAVTDDEYLARDELIRIFEADGFTVHGVITPIDPVYNKGLGAAYRDILAPQYARCGHELTDQTLGDDIDYKLAYVEFDIYELLQNIFDHTILPKKDLESFKVSYKQKIAEIQQTLDTLKSKTLTETQQDKHDTLQELFHQIDTVVSIDSPEPFPKRIQTIANKFLGKGSNWFATYCQANAAPPKQWDKGAMFAYFLANKPEWVQGCIYFDDKQPCLDTAMKMCEQIPQLQFTTVPVCFKQNADNKDGEERYYSELLRGSGSQQGLIPGAFTGFINEEFEDSVKKFNDYMENKSDTRKVLKIADEIFNEIHLLCEAEQSAWKTQTLTSTAPTHPSKILLLTTTLRTVTAALKNPNEDTLKACLKCAEVVDGKLSFGKQLAGLLLALVGALVIAFGITLSVATTAVTFGLAAPVSAPMGVGIVAAGAALVGGGSFLFFQGCRKGLSAKLVEFAEVPKNSFSEKGLVPNNV